jgi:hypothetical protein
MDESLAVMTVSWDLHPTEVNVLSTKQANGYDGEVAPDTMSAPRLKKAIVTRGVEAHFKSQDNNDGNADLLLYYAAVLSLDRTMQALGTDVV